MTKEKVANLTNYLNDLTNKLNNTVPDKHSKHPNEYKQFLQHEINMVKKTLDDAKLAEQKT